MSGSQCAQPSGLQGGPWGEAGVRIDWEQRVADVHLVHSIDSTLLLSTAQPSLYRGVRGLSGEQVWEFTTTGSTGALQNSGVSPVVGTVDFSEEEWSEEEERQFRLAASQGELYVALGVVSGPIGGDGPQPYEECAIRAQLQPSVLLGDSQRFEATLTSVPHSDSDGNQYGAEVRGSGEATYRFASGELEVELQWDGDFAEQQDLLEARLQFGVVGGQQGLEAFTATLSSQGGRPRSASATLFVSRYTVHQMYTGALYANVSTEEQPSGVLFGGFRWL